MAKEKTNLGFEAPILVLREELLPSLDRGNDRFLILFSV